MNYATIYDPATARSISALALRIMDTNLCKEIILDDSSTGVFYAPYIPKTMKLKYKFSRAQWYVAEFDIKDYTDVVHWCREQFGTHPRNPDAWSRWVHKYENRIHFRDEKDYQWFILRWGA